MEKKHAIPIADGISFFVIIVAIGGSYSYFENSVSADAGHIHKDSTAPTGTIDFTTNFCMKGGAYFTGPNSTITFTADPEDWDCHTVPGKADKKYEDTFDALTGAYEWTDGAGVAFTPAASNGMKTLTRMAGCPTVDTLETVKLKIKDDAKHAMATPGFQDFAALMNVATETYTVVVPTAATSGPGIGVGRCVARGRFAPLVENLRRFTTNIDTTNFPCMNLDLTGIRIGETTGGVVAGTFMPGPGGFCFFPMIATDIDTGQCGPDGVIDVVGIQALNDLNFGADCGVRYDIQWVWTCVACTATVPPTVPATGANPLQVFMYTWDAKK